MSWTDEGSIKARIFGINETPITNKLIIKAATGNERSALSTVAGKAMGGFVVAWLDVPQGLAVGSLKARIFDASGQAIGQEIKISDTDALVTVRPVIMSPLQADGFAVAWASNSGDLLTQAFKSDGTTFGPPAKVNGNDRALRGLAGTALTRTGRYAVAWTAGVPVNRKQLRVQTVNANGTFDGAALSEDVAEKTVIVEGEVSISEEADGGFTVAWIAEGSEGPVTSMRGGSLTRSSRAPTRSLSPMPTTTRTPVRWRSAACCRSDSPLSGPRTRETAPHCPISTSAT